MAEAYPLGLRTIIRASKSRTQPAAFAMAQPRRGWGYAQAIGTDLPVFWDVEFRFNKAEAQRFILWFRYVIGRGVDEFTMPIRTEFGTITHTCRFLPDALLDAGEDGECFMYRATIMARALIIPDEYVAAAQIIAGLPDWQTFADLLDETVNRALPEV